MVKDVEIVAKTMFWSYLWTGFKVFLISIILGGIYYCIDWLLKLFFKQGLFKLWIDIFNKVCTADVSGACIPNVSTFAMVITIFFTLVWLIFSMYIGGLLARKIWNWDNGGN